jgi:hypothetical protein
MSRPISKNAKRSTRSSAEVRPSRAPHAPRCTLCLARIVAGVWTSSGLFCGRCAVPVQFGCAS